MCNTAGIVFGATTLRGERVKGKRILEIGSLDVNGSLQDVIKCDEPLEYIGVDIEDGPGVDMVLGVEDVLEKFGPDRFDIVFATELVEHVEDWRKAFQNIKAVCKPGGTVLITTRSKGFQYHGFPHDFWRYEIEDMESIFADFKIEKLQNDPMRPGVFIIATKPDLYKESSLDNIKLYSVVTHNRTSTVTEADKTNFNKTYTRRKRLLGKFKSIQNTVLNINEKLFRS